VDNVDNDTSFGITGVSVVLRSRVMTAADRGEQDKEHKRDERSYATCVILGNNLRDISNYVFYLLIYISKW
jgi:hypothetical protein